MEHDLQAECLGEKRKRTMLQCNCTYAYIDFLCVSHALPSVALTFLRVPLWVTRGKGQTRQRQHEWKHIVFLLGMYIFLGLLLKSFSFAGRGFPPHPREQQDKRGESRERQKHPPNE